MADKEWKKNTPVHLTPVAPAQALSDLAQSMASTISILLSEMLEDVIQPILPACREAEGEPALESEPVSEPVCTCPPMEWNKEWVADPDCSKHVKPGIVILYGSKLTYDPEMLGAETPGSIPLGPVEYLGKTVYNILYPVESGKMTSVVVPVKF